MKKKLILSFFTLFLLLAATAAVVIYARGYRVDLQKKTLSPTGLLVATSIPDGASIFIDGHLTSATNTTLNLPPSWYQVKIVKEGYIPWEKKLRVQGEIVTKTDAVLFPAVPDLRPITTTGALNPTLSPDGTRLVYGVATVSAQKMGVWVWDLTEKSLLSLSPSLRLIARDSNFLSLSGASFSWSPDSKQVLARSEATYYLLEGERFNEDPKNITPTLSLILAQWENDVKTRETVRLSTLKPDLLKIATESMKIIAWAPDETKILYTATASAQIPPIITPALIGANSQPESRKINPGETYVYDLKEDKNFLILPKIPTPPASPFPLQWFPDSRHLIFVEKEKISILAYDGTNKATVYAGPFENSFVYPWPNGSKLIILSSFNIPAGVQSNLYTINLR